MSSRDNETHYNKPEGGGNEKSSRTRKPLSADRAKDKSKRSAKEGGSRDEPRSNRPFREGRDKPPFRKEGDRPFREKRDGDDRPPRPRREDGDKPFSRERGGDRDKPAFRKREEGDRTFREGRAGGDKPAFRKDNDRPSYRKDGDKPFREKRDGDAKPPFRSNRDNNERPAFRKDGDRPYREKREGGDDSPQRPRREDGDKPFSRERSSDRSKPGGARDGGPRGGDRPFRKYVPFEQREGSSEGEERPKRTFDNKDKDASRGERKPSCKGRTGAERQRPDDRAKPQEEKQDNPFEGEDFYEDERPFTRSNKWDEQAKEGPMTLNKYIAHSGVSSRREAASIIKDGKVKVNGHVLTEPGYRVKEEDKITYEDKVMTPQRNLVYILLNKPKGFITTTDDEKGRRTVMDLVANAGGERLYPVGRLDRATTGVLLITNDGDLAQKLSHPSYDSKKIYQVTLTEPLTKRDFDYIAEGNVKLEDGLAPVDTLAYLDKKNEIGIEIHSGKNRIVRRIFESLGYVVEKLDRVVYAGLTKKNVSRGKWRFLTEKEIINLKHFKG